MFSKATANFVDQIDPEGSLIHVSRVKDSHKLVPMALVVKRNRFWAWQTPRYHPTDFTLSDLLLGDEVLIPEVSEKEFLTFKGTYSDQHSGLLETDTGSASISLEGQGSTKLQSCFGKMKMEELDMKKLLSDSNNRLVDMQHVLVQQLEKRADVLAVVKDRILTTSSCTVTLTKKQQCTFQGLLGLLGLLGRSVQVCVKDVNNITMDSDISLEIPPGTVVAYSIQELEIKKDGHYGICLQPGAVGGFEEDSIPGFSSSDHPLDAIDSMHSSSNVQVPSGVPQNDFHEADLSPLSELPELTRCDLFKKLQETLKDRSVLVYLQCALEEVFHMGFIEEGSEMARMSSVLNQQGSDVLTELSEGGVTAELKAAHLLLSAMEELPDETLNLLSQSRPDFLEAFDKLMSALKEGREHLSIHSLPIRLQDNQVFQQAEQLLSSISVTLRRDADELWVEAGSDEKVLPLVLSLSVRGLSMLCLQ